MPMDGDAPVPMVDARHDTGTCTKALVQFPPGKNLLAFGSLMSWNEWVLLWGRIHGVKCTFVRMDRKVIENAMPGGIGEELADMFGYTSDFGYDGGDKSVVSPKDLGVDFSVSTAEEFIKAEDWSSVLGVNTS
ncbi:hypothetical protein ONS95_001873 [Cadophora gregata]|uniref:uncharacterized protein n=1 Tax=Cadophora gregata TaxID=51156 RepID=UPI0026DC57BD|nr:uncharacterized protein ONS95_001873 [Cadophora gregata]KAK0111519.1 hypothetical protein ONS95_001873 [Cadophora gregata]KAK0112005.1 hypothetical protein ONS96_001267 [Cadophora gregata f. sp. sojae]